VSRHRLNRPSTRCRTSPKANSFHPATGSARSRSRLRHSDRGGGAPHQLHRLRTPFQCDRDPQPSRVGADTPGRFGRSRRPPFSPQHFADLASKPMKPDTHGSNAMQLPGPDFERSARSRERLQATAAEFPCGLLTALCVRRLDSTRRTCFPRAERLSRWRQSRRPSWTRREGVAAAGEAASESCGNRPSR
jgi:hypothetical protein